MLYVIGADTGPLKVGRSKRPKARLQSLATGSDRAMLLLYQVEVAEGLDAEVEALAQVYLREHWTRGEWFNVTLDAARAAIDQAVLAAHRGERAYRKPMGRKPLGGAGEKTVMVPMRWAPALLARVDAARGEEERSAFIREAVERELKRRGG